MKMMMKMTTPLAFLNQSIPIIVKEVGIKAMKRGKICIKIPSKINPIKDLLKEICVNIFLMVYAPKVISAPIVMSLKIFLVNTSLLWEIVIMRNAGKNHFFNIFNFYRFSHKNIDKDGIQKFIHDNEQYVLDAKKKHGKTRIDRDINEYLRRKNGNRIHSYNNRSKMNNNNMNNINNMNNTNNANLQMLNNPIFTMLLLQNQLLLQQQRNNNSENNGDNLQNNIANNIKNNNVNLNNDSNEIKEANNVMNENNQTNLGNNDENKDMNKIEGVNDNDNNSKNDILQKILAVLNNPLINNINYLNNLNNISNNNINNANDDNNNNNAENNNIINDNEGEHNKDDPRKKK